MNKENQITIEETVNSESKFQKKQQGVPIKFSDEEFKEHLVKVKGKEELDKILFKLKKYYNELKSIRTKGEERIKTLTENNKFCEDQAAVLDSLKDIPIPSANVIVSIKNQSSNSSETKQDIENKIKNLLETKKNLQDGLLIEKEYSNTLKHMIDHEKTKMENINKKIADFTEKSNAIKLSKKVLEENELEHQKKIKNFLEVKHTLLKETEKLNKVISNQNESEQKLKKELETERLNLERKRNELSNLEANKKAELIEKKIEIEKTINTTKDLKENNLNEENFNIKLILGMSIIQNYFINKFHPKNTDSFQNFNEKEILKSKDYKDFCGNKFILTEENPEEEGKISHKNTDSKNMKFSNTSGSFYQRNSRAVSTQRGNIQSRQSIHSNSSIKRHGSFLKIKKKNSSMDYLQQEIQEEVVKTINIKELKAKFDQLNVKVEDIIDFYTKLNSQIAQYQNTMMTFNQKQIHLESKKDIYTEKVKEILKKNYKNFDDLVKNNSKFNNFMTEYQDKLKKEIEQEKLAKFIELPENPSEYLAFYNKCNNIISEFKAFFEYIYNNFRALYQELDENGKNHFNINEVKSELRRILYDVLPYIGQETDEEFIVKLKKDFIRYYNENIKDAIENDKIINEKQKNKKVEGENNNDNNVHEAYSRNSYDLLDINIFKETQTLESFYKFFQKLNPNDFIKIKIPYEKINYAFFSNSMDTLNLFKKINSMIEYILMSKFGGIYSKSSTQSTSIDDLLNYVPKLISGKEQDFEKDLLEEDKEIFENDHNEMQNSKAKLKKYFNSSTSIIDKLYKPTLGKNKFKLGLNENMGKIKQMTRSDAMINYDLRIRKTKIDKFSNEILIYNNPRNFLIKKLSLINFQTIRIIHLLKI